MSEAANAITSSLAPWAYGSPANSGDTPQTLTATCGTWNCEAISRTTTHGSSRGSRVSSSSVVQRCSLSAMAEFSLPWRIISTAFCSRPLILSRSNSAWRSCRLTARLPCGLVSCTVPSRLAWRTKKSGVLAR
ncbi:hypothetical protein D9M69_601970 [compost metagenome]